MKSNRDLEFVDELMEKRDLKPITYVSFNERGIEDKGMICARQVNMPNGVVKYECLMMDGATLYDPISICDSEQKRDQIKGNKFVMRYVNQKVFDSYVNYLKTRKHVYLSIAERDMESY